MSNMALKRDPGYYWVKVGDLVRIADYDDEGYWIPGGDYPLRTVEVIGRVMSAEWVKAATEEIERLRAFHDAVVSSITEHAGAGQEYAYIWQNRWDEIKAKAAGGEE